MSLSYIDMLYPNIILVILVFSKFIDLNLRLNTFYSFEFKFSEQTDKILSGDIASAHWKNNSLYVFDYRYSRIIKIDKDKSLHILIDKGNGPGEINDPETVRFTSDHIVVTYFDGMIKLFDYNGDVKIEQLIPAKYAPLSDLVPLSNRYLLVTGRVPFNYGLHLFDTTLSKSIDFYKPIERMKNNNLRSIGWINATHFSDTIAVLHSLKPVIEFFNHSGESTGELSLIIPENYVLPNFDFPNHQKENIIKQTHVFTFLKRINNYFFIQWNYGIPIERSFLGIFDIRGDLVSHHEFKNNCVGIQEDFVITQSITEDSFTLTVNKINLN